ncbi:MAG: V-type ATPase 116kDa subunit family protein [Odoribacter sp.]
MNSLIPTPDEDVPVLLENNRFTKLFEPITEMFALPNYHESDPTPFFAPFFMLFFGLCMGDGGYGLLIWLVCFLLAKKAKPAMKGYLVLGEDISDWQRLS